LESLPEFIDAHKEQARCFVTNRRFGVKQGMNEQWMVLLVGIFAYLIGSIPVGFLVARAKGINIKLVGSGNIGATNITRSLGLFWGATVGVVDFLKGFLPALFIQRYFTQDWLVFLLCLLPVIGHIFPLWLNFKGGKGVATIFGIIAAFFGLPFFFAFLVIWFIVVKLVNVMSLVNLVMALLFPLAFWIKFKDVPHVLFGLILSLIIWWSHRKNLQRLIAGKENRIAK